MLIRRIAICSIVLAALLACSPSETESNAASETSAADASTTAPSQADTAAAAGVRLVSATDGASILASPPADLVVLDVRTPEEFDEAHLEGATILDFYREDFGSALAELDRDVPYLLYCRSGNRSGQAAAAMRELGFTDVADVDGGILAWDAEGLPTDN